MLNIQIELTENEKFQKLLFMDHEEKFWNQMIEKIVKVMIDFNIIHENDQRDLSFYFCENEEMKSINEHYKGKNDPTDVLAFPFESNEILGEIIISIEKAQENAHQKNMNLFDEILFLIIHGILHLLGYDHEKSLEDEKIMFDLQDKIFNEVIEYKND